MTDDKKKGIPKKTVIEDEIVDLDISAEKSLHRPLKIRVGGKIFESAKLTPELFDTLTVLQLRGEAGDPEAAYQQYDLVFGVKRKDLKGIDLRDVGIISEVVGEALANSKPSRIDPEKKVEGPGKPS